MRHDARREDTLSEFTFPPLSAGQQQLILDLGSLLVATGDRYLQHLDTELRLLREAAGIAGLASRQDGVVMPLRRRLKLV
ncbi:MAG: hypothetical protein OEY86_15160 [Nitrospira sp.]|nr:hypothetical protein [Nitrospira sp.]